MKSTPNHTFDIYLAEQHGVHEAIIIHHFQHWVRVNKKLKKNFRDGRTWTYQTLEWISAHFPYLSKKQIERLINRLVMLKIIVKGNYNHTPYDRTIWYAFYDESLFLETVEDECVKENLDAQVAEPHHIPKSGNGSPEIGTPIPDTKNIYLNIDIDRDDPIPPKPPRSTKPNIDFDNYIKEEQVYRRSLKTPEEMDAYDRITALSPVIGQPVKPRDAHNWIVRYGVYPVFIAADRYLQQCSARESFGLEQIANITAYIQSILSNRNKEASTPEEENRSHAEMHEELLCNLYGHAGMMKITKNYVEFPSIGKDFEFCVDPMEFKQGVDAAVEFLTKQFDNKDNDA